MSKTALLFRIRILVVLLCAVFIIIASSVPAFALENNSDTIWGSVPASAYITMAFYKNGNTIKIPFEYLDAVAEGTTYSDKAVKAYHEAFKQSAYLFSIDSLSIREADGHVVLTRNPVLDADKEKSMMDTLETTANRIIAEIITGDMTDYQKAVAIYDYVRTNTTYDWDAYNAIRAEDWVKRKAEYCVAVSAYGNLILGKSVCQGDAQAYNLLARKAGLTSIMASGAIGDLNHAWNRVWANGQWYELDCTYSRFYKSFSQYSAAMGGVEYTDNSMLESSMEIFYGK